MSVAVWYRQDAGWLVSSQVMETGEFMIFWPVILTMLKLRGGRLSDAGLTDFAIKSAVRMPCPARPATTAIRDAFANAGLLVRDDGGWTTPNWDEYQPDRRAAGRERKNAKSEPETTSAGDSQPDRPREPSASQDVPGNAGTHRMSQDVPAHAGYGTGRDGTEQTNAVVPAEAVGCSNQSVPAEVGTRARETPARVGPVAPTEPRRDPPSAAPQEPPTGTNGQERRDPRDIPEPKPMPLCPSERDAQRKLREILTRNPSGQERNGIRDACNAHGPDLVVQALDESGASSHGPWTLSFFRAVLKRIVTQRRENASLHAAVAAHQQRQPEQRQPAKQETSSSEPPTDGWTRERVKRTPEEQARIGAELDKLSALLDDGHGQPDRPAPPLRLVDDVERAG